MIEVNLNPVINYEIIGYDSGSAVLSVRFFTDQYPAGYVFSVSALDYGTREFIPEAELDQWIRNHAPRGQLVEAAKLQNNEHPEYLTKYAIPEIPAAVNNITLPVEPGPSGT